MTEVWREYWPKDAPTRTTVVAELVSATALVEIAVIAVPDGGERTIITPAGWSTGNPYSYAIKTGDTLFMSGLVSRGAKDNQPVEGDVTTQMNTIFANADELLKTAGFTMADVVANRVYLTDGATFQEMNKAYVPHLPEEPAGARHGDRRPAGASLQGRGHDDGGQGSEGSVRDAGGRRHTRQAESDAEQRDQGRQAPLCRGILGNNADNKGNVEAQTKEALTRIERTLKAAGFEWTDLVDAVVYITDVNNFQGMNNAYRPILAKDFPARATVRTGLVGADGLVEIMFVASK